MCVRSYVRAWTVLGFSTSWTSQSSHCYHRRRLSPSLKKSYSADDKVLMIMKSASLVWAGAVEKSELSYVDVGHNRARGRRNGTFSPTLAGQVNRSKICCIPFKLDSSLFLLNINAILPKLENFAIGFLVWPKSIWLPPSNPAKRGDREMNPGASTFFSSRWRG